MEVELNMGQISRAVVPGYPQHITQKKNRRQQTFFCAEDYRAAYGSAGSQVTLSK
jgi:REP element-mobilizing transposase RayT